MKKKLNYDAVGILTATILVGVIVFMPETVLANPFQKLIGKFDTVFETILSIIKSGCIVAFAIAGVKWMRGGADAADFSLKVVVGSFIVYAGSSLVQWLST